jgi:hypothetical protein
VDTLLPPLCLLLGIAIPLGVIWAVLRRGARPIAVAAAYRDVARRLGLQVDTRGLSVHGYLDGRRLWVGEVMEGYGKTRRHEVRGVLGLSTPLGLGLVVSRRPRRRRKPESVLGDEALDERVSVRADDLGRAVALFQAPVRETLRALTDRWPDVVLTDHEVRVELSAAEPTADRLEELIRRMVALANAAETAREAVPVPEPLVPQVAGWTALAEARALEPLPSLPGMRGTIEGRGVLAAARRDHDGFAAEVRVTFRDHPSLGLVLLPQPEDAPFWVRGQDIEVGDRRFDDAFIVKGYSPQVVAARLSAEARERLLDLARSGRVEVDDHGIVVTGVGLDARFAERALDLALAAADALGW